MVEEQGICARETPKGRRQCRAPIGDRIVAVFLHDVEWRCDRSSLSSVWGSSP